MTDPVGRATVRRLVERMRGDPRVLDGVVAAARDRSASVAALPLQEVRRHIAALLDAAVDAFANGSVLGDGVRAADRLATDRAIQGVPLEALLDGFQAGRVHVLQRLIEASRAAEVPAGELMDALLDLDSYSNELQNRVVHAYRSTELELARTAYAIRAQALRDLLHGDPVSGIGAAGLDEARRYHCLLADVTDPHEARRIEPHLVTDGVAGLVDGYLCGVSARLPDPARTAGLLVVASPAVRPGELAECYRMCRAALVSAGARGLRGLRQLTHLAVAVATDAQPRLGAMLAGEHLAALDRADGFHRLLAETALAYLEHGGRADVTAAALHVHPNTVKHRLRRFGELTGFGELPPDGAALAYEVRWWWSLRTWLTSGSGG